MISLGNMDPYAKSERKWLRTVDFWRGLRQPNGPKEVLASDQ